MVISDFVPFYERDIKQIFSYAMISVICLTTFVYLLFIIVSTFMILFNTLKTKYEQHLSAKFQKAQEEIQKAEQAKLIIEYSE